jgi:hypothetical protein
MFWTFRTIGLGTPPPCPVDDAPYTTCCATATAVPAHRGTIVARLRKPYTAPDAPPILAIPSRTSAPFTAADYRRATHGHRTP